MKKIRPKVPIGILPFFEKMQYKKYLDQLENKYKIHYININEYNEKKIETWLDYCRHNHIQSVLSFAHEKIYLQTIMNARLGMPSFSMQSCLYSLNKFLTRQLGLSLGWYTGVFLSEKEQDILSRVKSYPCMLKSTLHNLAAFVFKIDTPDELIQKMKQLRQAKPMQLLENNRKNYLSFNTSFLKQEEFPPLMLEEFIDVHAGVKQFSVDCYSDQQGYFHPFVVREELYLPSLQKIGYLCPPSSLNKEELEKLANFIQSIGRQFIKKRHLNQFFNIECWLTANGKFYLTEINPVPNLNFTGMYELMEKKSLIEAIIDLHYHGLEPVVPPFEKIKQGLLKNIYLQSEINTVKKGIANKLFDFKILKKIEACSSYHLLYLLNNKNFEFKNEHMSISGWPIVELYLAGKTIEDVLQQDQFLRTLIYK